MSADSTPKCNTLSNGTVRGNTVHILNPARKWLHT